MAGKSIAASEVFSFKQAEKSNNNGNAAARK
jgi:hypothetical protein